MLKIVPVVAALLLLPTPLLAAQSNTNQTAKPEAKTAKPTTSSLAEKNLAEANAFLEENKKKPNVVTLPSGLQYKVITQGTGTPPGPVDFVTVNYRGTLLDGTEFDSSYKRGTPSTFAVNAIIPGWSEALQLMTPGSKWELYVPPNLAYGEQGAGRQIEPNSLLNFEVELIAVKQPTDNDTGPLEETEEDG